MLDRDHLAWGVQPTAKARHRARLVVAGVLALSAALAVAPGGSAQVLYGVDTGVDAAVLLDRAESGDTRAAYLLGLRFANGLGGTRDDSEAIKWFRRAAEGGLPEAQFNLGVMYASGRGVEKDMVQAARWYRLAAEKGLALAQLNLGLLYARGVGVPINEQLAAEWLRQAADRAMPEAQFSLGYLYEYGRGVPRNRRAAIAWYEQAAGQGYAPAAERLARLRGGAEPTPIRPTVGELTVVDHAAATAPAGAGETAAAPAPAVRIPAPRAARSAGDGDWVRDLDPSHFTMQLSSDTSERSVRRFIDEHLAGREAGYFSWQRGDTVWYSVVAGDFPTREAAAEAVAALPPELQRSKPWVRRVADVHAQMR